MGYYGVEIMDYKMAKRTLKKRMKKEIRVAKKEYKLKLAKLKEDLK